MGVCIVKLDPPKYKFLRKNTQITTALPLIILYGTIQVLYAFNYLRTICCCYALNHKPERGFTFNKDGGQFGNVGIHGIVPLYHSPYAYIQSQTH